MEGDTSGVFGRRPLKEVVTPHKLSLLSLVFEYTQRKSDDGGKGFTQKQMTDFMTCILKLLQSPDVTLQELLTRLRRILEQTLHEAFSERLKKFYSDGVSAIMDFFELLSQLMGNKTDAGPVITKSSILGIFIRRMILAFEKLSFSQVISLYGQFKVYYESVYAPLSSCEGEESGDLSKSIAELSMSLPSFSALSKANLTKNLEALSLSEGYGKEITGGFYSQKQAEYFISQQVFLLQHNENEALSPPKLQQKILEILKVNPDLAEAHFLSYLNHLRVKEYVTALHSHFHYFDRHTFTSPDDKLKDEDVRLRYAALNLASLHFRFRHRKEAKAALQEAIQLAQENNDHICLQHALGWLYRLGETGDPTTVDLMERSITKTGELNLPYLTSLGVQAFARHNALSTVKPASIFDSLMKSDILNCQHSQSKFMCVSYSQKAALWHMYGKREMSSMASQLALHLNTSDCGIYHSGESDCVALCNLARQHTDQGRYSAAFEMINNAKKQAPPTSQHAHIWMSCEQEMTFTKAVLAGNWHVAEQAIQNLKAVSQQESDIRQALLLKEQGQATPALTLIHKLLRDSPEERALLDKPDLTADYKCRLLLLLAELFCQTGSALAAIPHLLECLTLARSHHLEYLVALAGVLLAYVQYMMQLPSQALSILDEHMMRVLTNGSLYDQAKVLYLYGKCQVAAASKAADGHRKSDLLPVVSMMTTVIDMFSRVEATRRVKDAVYFQARLYHELGYTAERNKCAHRFRLLDKQQATLSAVLVSGV